MRINEKGVLINYSDDPDVTRLTIPDTVTRIAPHAFYGAEYLEEIIISGGVTDIGAEAFRGCPELRSVMMPDSVARLGKYAFADCRQLRHVRLSAGLGEIPEGAFDNCHSLLAADIPEGVERIGSHAFNVCVSMETVTLPDSLREICHGAFNETFSLKSLHIPDGVSGIESYTFFRSRLEHISYRGFEVYWENGDTDEWLWNLCFSEDFAEKLSAGEFARRGLPREYRDAFLLAYYAKTFDPKAGEYIGKHFSKLFRTVIRTGNIPAAKALIGTEGFLTTRNINRYIGIASESGHEIYLMLLEQKEKLGGYKKNGSQERFRL